MIENDPNPTGNTAELLKQLGQTNTSEINLFSSAIGTIADASGVAGAVFSVVTSFIGLFGSPSDPNQEIEKILKQLEKAFEAMFASLKARQTQIFWIQLANQVSEATSVLQSLGGFVHSQPPLTDNDRHTHIDTCLNPLNALGDTTIVPVTGPYFLAAFSDQVYWTDPSNNPQAFFVLIANPDGNTPLWQESGAVDTGYGLQAPPAPTDNLVFSYLYVLPYYIKAAGMALTVGGSLFDDFGKNGDREQAALLSFSEFLLAIHDKIADEGIRMLTPPDPSAVPWNADCDHRTFVPGIAMGTSESDITANPPDADRMTFETGAVEVFSGCSSIYIAPTFLFGTTPIDSSEIFRKLQIRGMHGMMNIYKSVGLPSVRSTVNDLRRVAGSPLLAPHPLARWSFREVFNQASVGARNDGLFHLRDLAGFIETTPPFDTVTPAGAAVSWRHLLEPN